MAKLKFYKPHFIFLIFAQVWPMRTILTDTPTHRDTHTSTDKPMAIGEIVHICLKILNGWPLTRRSRSRSAIFAYTPFDGKCLYTCLPQIFALALIVSEIWKFNFFYLQKVGRDHGVSFSQFDGKRQNLQMSPTHLCAISYHFSDRNIKLLIFRKCTSRSRRTISKIHHLI